MRNRRMFNKRMVFFTVLFVVALAPTFAPLPYHVRSSNRRTETKQRSFVINDDAFWKDGQLFQIIGGDLHYFRVVPQYWEDRLIRAKSLGLNTIQTYVPWNLHEPKPENYQFDGIADLVGFIELCKKLDLLVMLRPGPYICAEWDLGGFPSWLLAVQPPLRLRSSDPAYLRFVDRWWEVLLPKIFPLLYNNGGPIIMLQIENEFGSYGDDQVYLHHLVTLARNLLGDDLILYTTDGGSWDTLNKGTVKGAAVFSAVDFTTGDNPWPIFELQKKFNLPGKSPPLSAEFYTGWLSHWGEKLASTDAKFTANALASILSRNGSAVLYMAHGGTNFGFYSGANTGANSSSYKPDLTSYDYDAPIQESGDVDNAKYAEIRTTIRTYSATTLPAVPPNIEKASYGSIKMQRYGMLFNLIDVMKSGNIAESVEPISMEVVGQAFGLLLYMTNYTQMEEDNILYIPEVHDKAQVFILCSSEINGKRPTYVGDIDRWSNKKLRLRIECSRNVTLLILTENLGRVNYGPYIFDRKGILSSVYLNQEVLHGWKMASIPLDDLKVLFRPNSLIQTAHSTVRSLLVEAADDNYENGIEPSFFAGNFTISTVKDTYLAFRGWGKGIAFVNYVNIGRYWPSAGPQCNLYVPAPLLKLGENTLILLELESRSVDGMVHSVARPDFTCGSSDR